MTTDGLEGVRALVFDVFGTVVDWRSGVARDAGSFLARHGVDHVDPAEFADAWRRRYSPAMEEVRSGRRPFARLDVLHRENLNGVLKEFGIDPTRIPSTDLDDLNLAWRRLDPWPDSVAGLKRLKEIYYCAAIELQHRATTQHGQARRASLGRDPGRRGGEGLQTDAGSLPQNGRCSSPSP